MLRQSTICRGSCYPSQFFSSHVVPARTVTWTRIVLFKLVIYSATGYCIGSPQLFDAVRCFPPWAMAGLALGKESRNMLRLRLVWVSLSWLRPRCVRSANRIGRQASIRPPMTSSSHLALIAKSMNIHTQDHPSTSSFHPNNSMFHSQCKSMHQHHDQRREMHRVNRHVPEGTTLPTPFCVPTHTTHKIPSGMSA